MAHRRITFWHILLLAALSGWCWVIPSQTSADEAATVAEVFEQQCARCHGADGQGVAGSYEVALTGPRSVAELARLIERTMPEDSPEDCVGDEARQVAQYIYDEFYSPAARLRKGLDPPLRTEIMRLTVPQYRNAVADLIGHFTPDPAESRRRNSEQEPRRRGASEGDAQAQAHAQSAEASVAQVTVEPGLRGSYYRSKGMSKADELALERTDARLDVDFQAGAPVEGMPDDQFAIVWEGALAASETGEYQFRVTTPNGARLYLNLDPARGLRKLRDDSSAAGQSALIDAWVSSGKLREASARVFLLGGRYYPLRLEFFKYHEPTASLKLEWKPPHGAWSILDHNHVTTAEVGRTFAVEAPFPADDRSQGYERGTSVSHEWYVAAANAAVVAAEEVVQRLPLLADDDSNVAEAKADTERGSQANTSADGDAVDGDAVADLAARQKRLQDFVVQLARVAFRRPLTAEDELRLRELPFAGQSNPEAAVRRAIVWILCSPDFLYADLTPADAPPGPHAIAARLALAIWDSLPDAQLMVAAEAGELITAEQVQRQARRMLQDPRSRHKVQSFFGHWLEIEDRDLSKDRQMFPAFDEQVIADLRASLELFVDEVVWSESSDYRQLVSADHLWLNQRLIDLYSPLGSGEPAAAADASATEFHRIDFPSQGRAGVLTHPYLLSAFAYHNNTSPIHRGVFLTRNIVGRAMKPPPMAVAFKNDEFAPELTMREKITQLTGDSNCMACHSVINPLGFALEHFDAVGRWRTEENNRPVDSKSQYTTETGETIEVDSARDIARLALASESAHRAFVVQLFQHLTKQNPAAYGPSVVEQLRAEFETDSFHIQNLIVRIAVMAAMHGPSVSEASAVIHSGPRTETPTGTTENNS